MKTMKKPLFALMTVFVMLIAMLPAAAGAAGTMTVQEAIDNNTGNGTVTGYIVGHTISGSNYNTKAPFSNDFNIAIADSANETDPAKILPVQLPSSFRAQFGLQTNPDMIGEKIVVTGQLTAYFNVPGLKNPTAITVDGAEPGEPDPFEGIEGLRIHDIQGESHTSPYNLKNVKEVEGIVTHVVDGSNFYMQDDQPDDNEKTSEGILVYKPSHGVRTGDAVKVDGQVKEWVLDGYAEKLQTDLTTTEINSQNGNVVVQSSGNELPEALVIGKDIFPPTDVIDSDGLEEFNPDVDAIDFYESIEGMRISLEDPTVTGPQKYGELPVITEQVEGKNYTKEGAPLLTADNQNPERMFIQLQDRNFVAKTGDQFEGTVTGVVSYSFSNFKILVNDDELPALNEREFTPETTTIEKDDEKLTIASYNIENFDASDATKRDKLAKSMVENLGSPDIIGLVEVLDDSGTKDDGTVKADGNYKALSDASVKFGGPAYEWTEIAPQDKQDGGVPGGNIRVGYLYNPERVTLAEGEKGDQTTAVGYEDGSLTLNPGRIDPTNDAFRSSRKSLAAQFDFNGEDVIVIANHFNSKGGDEPLFGRNQPPTLGSETQRLKIAEVINGFVSDIESKNEDANVVVLGDLNDFEFSAPLQKLKGEELTNLIETLPANERYTYSYQGNAQVLDHMLVSNRLADQAEFDIVNFNSPYMEEHGRASDHDALVAQLDLNAQQEPEEPKDFDLSILHTNDSHAHVEQYPRLVTALDDLRKPNSLLVDAGDVFSGTLYFRQYLGLADLSFMNDLNFDAMTFGNHEFDKDSNILANFIKEMKFPMVSSNVNVTADKDLSPLYKDEIGDPAEGGKIYPAIIKEIDGEKVGIFGLTTPDTSFLANPSEDIVFEDVVESSNATISMLQEEGVNKIVVLSHLGYGPDQDLAEEVEGIDVIVGGHSHTALKEPTFVEKDEPTLIVQTGEYLNNIGNLDVTFDPDGVIKEYKGELVPLANYEKDPEAEAKVQEFKAPLDELMSEVVGSSDVPLNGERADVRTKETNLGNLITDGMVAKANESVKTHIAFQNGGGIRASIGEGDITLGDVLTTLPFGNNLVAIDLTGEEIKQALEHSVSAVESGEGRFLQVSGIKFKYDVNQPVGERVWSVDVKTDNGFEKLDPAAMYTVATNAFTADGGDGYSMLKEAKDDGRMTELFQVDFEVMTEYLEKNSPVSPELEDRIVQEVKQDDPGDGGGDDGDGDDDGHGGWGDQIRDIIKKLKNWLCKLLGVCGRP